MRACCAIAPARAPAARPAPTGARAHRRRRDRAPGCVRWRSQHSILEENPTPRDAAGGRLTSPQESARVCHIQRLNASGTHVHTKIDVKPARCGANFPAYWSVRFCGNPIPEPGKRCAQRPHIVRLAIQDKALRSGNTRSRSCVPLTGRGLHMDIPRPSLARTSRICRALYAAGAVVLLAAITLGVSRLRPAAPSVERTTVWGDAG